MNHQVREVKAAFATELHRRCSEKYHKFPSNEKLARDLCLTSKHHLKVSRETIRKWLKGDTFPDLDCLLHLIEWLQLDVRNIFLQNEYNSKITENIQIESNSLYSNDIPVQLDVDQINLIIKALTVQASAQAFEMNKSNSNF